MRSSNNLPDEDLISKIESVEGKTLYAIIRLKSHPINLKTFFNFGHITLFEEGKRNGYYKGELVSLESLNQHMDWTTDYFKRLRACLEEQKKDITYSFASGNDDPDNQTKIFKIIFKISKGADIIGMNVKCSFISTNKVLENLMNEMTAINQSKKKNIKDLEKKIENLETEKMVILENMNDVAQAKEQLETELLDKFTVILNEKKKKIASLQQEIDGLKNIRLVPQRDPVTGIIERTRDTKFEEEVPTQLTTYELNINGSQFDFIREPKAKDRKNIREDSDVIIRSQPQTQSQSYDPEMKIEPEIEIYDKKPVTEKKRRGPDLEDLFK